MKNNFKNRQLIARVMDMAKLHQTEGEMAASAKSCYETACSIMSRAWNNNRVDITGVEYWALKSLAYSVGMFHADYKTAKKNLEKAAV
jgi:hypothetical protein